MYTQMGSCWPCLCLLCDIHLKAALFNSASSHGWHHHSGYLCGLCEQREVHSVFERRLSMYSLSFVSSNLIQCSKPHNLAPSLAHEVLLSWTTVPSIIMMKFVSSLWA